MLLYLHVRVKTFGAQSCACVRACHAYRRALFCRAVRVFRARDQAVRFDSIASLGCGPLSTRLTFRHLFDATHLWFVQSVFVVDDHGVLWRCGDACDGGRGGGGDGTLNALFQFDIDNSKSQ